MKIIALYGSQGAGKSTAANAIAELPGWTKLSFATPLYKMLDVILGQDVRNLDKNESREELGGKTIHHALQSLGTEWGRGMLGETVWLDHMHRRIERFYDVEGVVIDDLRFANEYQFVRDRGACVVKISKGEAPWDEGQHASENDWRDFESDLYVHNTTENIKTLHHAARLIVERATYTIDPKIEY